MDELKIEWGSVGPAARFPTSDGGFCLWGDEKFIEDVSKDKNKRAEILDRFFRETDSLGI